MTKCSRCKELETQLAATREVLGELEFYPKRELEKIVGENYLDGWFEDEKAHLEALIARIDQILQSDAGRAMLERIRKLEKVAEAAERAYELFVQKWGTPDDDWVDVFVGLMRELGQRLKELKEVQDVDTRERRML